jgi:hypothetical protein
MSNSSSTAPELHSEFPRLIDDWEGLDSRLSPAPSTFPATAAADVPTLPRLQPAAARLPDELLETLEQVARLDQPGQRALLLALLLTPQSARERQAWHEEIANPAGGMLLLDLAQQIPAEAAPALLEKLLLLHSATVPATRVELLRSVRRIMCADGRVRPIDRLRWLLIRHVLARPYGQDSHTVRGSSGNSDMAILAPGMRQAVAHLTAFLARIVPLADPVNKVGAMGITWYRAALRPWWGEETPNCELPDGDQLVQAIVEVRTLSWMQRPVLTRTWVDSAMTVARRHRSGSDPRVGLQPEAAEALRLVSRLLDTPLPPALARCFIECPDELLPPPDAPTPTP